MELCDALPDSEYLIGEIYDLDGREIVPAPTDQICRAIETCIGNYRLCASVASVHGKCVTIDGNCMTDFIQRDWTRLMEDEKRQADEGSAPSQSIGFLAAYQGVRRAVGRLAEDVVMMEVLKQDFLEGRAIEKYFSISEAWRAGEYAKPGAGNRCDDLLLVTQNGEKYLVEVKASAAGRPYLAKSIPKALGQVRRSLACNPGIEGIVLVFVNAREGDKYIVLIVGTRLEALRKPDLYWSDLYLSLAPERKRPS